MDEFAGKVAVITGAASGIGLGLARTAAREGMRVVMADIEAAVLDEAAAEVAALGADTLAVPTDVSDAAAVEALAAAAFDTFGGAHLVCLNAGVFQAGVSWQRTEADWAWVLGVNLWGPIHGVRAFMPRLIEQGEPAHVVITSSMAGMLTVAYSGPYVVSKFGAAALAECVAHDVRAQGVEHIGVSCLVPGSVDTRIGWSDRNRPRRAAVRGHGAGPRVRGPDAPGDDLDAGPPARRGRGDGVRGCAGRAVLDPDDGELRGAARAAACGDPGAGALVVGAVRLTCPKQSRQGSSTTCGSASSARCSRTRSTGSAGSRAPISATSPVCSSTGATGTTGAGASRSSRRTTSTRIDVDGQRIHALVARSPNPDALPLLLVHGWPGSVVEFLDAVGPLTDPAAHGGDSGDAFHVVAPSLPGFGFSGPTHERGWHPRRIAAAFVELMADLGFDRFGAQGGDWGSVVTANVADLVPGPCGRAAPQLRDGRAPEGRIRR